MSDRILELEETAINAFPALQTELYRGWILRFSDGYTHRGNCVNPLYPLMGDMEEALSYCEERYFSLGLNCTYKLTPGSLPELECLLSQRGYDRKNSAVVMTASLSTPVEDPAGVTIAERVSSVWLGGFLALKGVDKPAEARAARAMIGNISLPVYCASIRRGGKPAGCALGVLERGRVGLFDLYVDPELRRQGLGGALCRAVMNAGFRDGAGGAYLQVAVGNEGAQRLYESLGFTPCYEYWYRVRRCPGQLVEEKDPQWAK
ncbi:GNAT family N-acetyltransferase [Papillibacter cinnamivorans]|uniref:Acetyltransferase (GNAT) family protein n=1 Tax=Papillibacter cinnamivorans DSM 12816 TaxID=1122930 RepID=A0A1W2C6E4_9FIRM|nr:GNAT family N-acetyltransferase [Papillibacter cinnamivorans]SMC80594.1 Acetyltransferase (GNAT) family protein [Papillibacter cinnamivorans DSM 12816]